MRRAPTGAEGGACCYHKAMEEHALGFQAWLGGSILLTRDGGLWPRPGTGALSAKGVLERSGGAGFAQGEPAVASDGVGRRVEMNPDFSRCPIDWRKATCIMILIMVCRFFQPWC